MKRYHRILVAASAVALLSALGSAPKASADVAPVNRVSCPSVADINQFRPSNSSEPALSGVSQASPEICLYIVKGIPNVLFGLTFGSSSYTLTPADIQNSYDKEALGELSNVQPLPTLGSNAYSFADPQGFTVVNWQFSPGTAAYANLHLSWMIPAQASIAKLFHPTMEVYTIGGERTVNGRQWRTTCENYSATARCRTEIFATTIKKTDTGFQTVNGWVFNSLTYRWANRALWKNNPLGNAGSWTSADGRKWQTECDTPATGRGACRSYIMTTVYSHKGGKYTQANKWVFNNQVLFRN